MRRALAGVAAAALSVSLSVGAAPAGAAAPPVSVPLMPGPVQPNSQTFGAAVIGDGAVYTLTPDVTDTYRREVYRRPMVPTATGTALGEPRRVASAGGWSIAEDGGTLAYLSWPDERLVLRAPDGSETYPAWGDTWTISTFGPSSLSASWFAAGSTIYNRATGAAYDLDALSIGLPVAPEGPWADDVTVTEDRALWSASIYVVDGLHTAVFTVALGPSGPQGPVTMLDQETEAAESSVRAIGISGAGDPVWLHETYLYSGNEWSAATAVRWVPGGAVTQPYTEVVMPTSDFAGHVGVSGSQVSVGFDMSGTNLFLVDLDHPTTPPWTRWFSLATVLAVRGSLVATSDDGGLPMRLIDVQDRPITAGEDLPPSVSTVEPPSGSPLGGTAVTITGLGVAAATSVTFGGVAATGLQVLSPWAIKVTAPAHAAGTAPVVVTTPLGTSAGTAFTYIPYVGQTPSRVLTDLVVPPGVVR
ncbi:MAG TPA: IPT/TIG domain-containing protein, partial [Propionicimonas sp.]